MMTKRKYIALAAAILMVGATAMPASAKPAKWKKNQRSAPSSFAPAGFAPGAQNLPRWAQRSISASEAKSIARRKAGGGEVVDISRNGNNWRVRVIRKDGKVVDVLIDATTGRVK